MRELIVEKLKDKDYVRAFGLMSKEEREVYKKVGKDNCLAFGINNWLNGIGEHFDWYMTYAIKPDYQAQPEFVDLEIGIYGGFLGVDKDPRINWPSGIVYSCRLSCIVEMPNFECFYVVAKDLRPNLNVDISLCEVAKHKSEGKKVYARFRRDK